MRLTRPAGPGFAANGRLHTRRRSAAAGGRLVKGADWVNPALVDQSAIRQLLALQELSHLGPLQTITSEDDELKYATAGAIGVTNDQLKGGLILPTF